jgi:hypothetical protein
MFKTIKITVLVTSVVFLFEYAHASQINEGHPNGEFDRTNEEWPEFDKGQLKDLAQGRPAYQKNPVTNAGELFTVDKTSRASKAYKDFKTDIQNVEAGDLKPNFDTKNSISHIYDSKYGKIKILVKPSSPSLDIDDDASGNASAQPDATDKDPNDVSNAQDNIKDSY